MHRLAIPQLPTPNSRAESALRAPQHLVRMHQLGLALELEIAHLLHIKSLADRLTSRLADQHAIQISLALQPRRGVDCVAHHSILQPLARAEEAGVDRAGVDA